MTRRMSPRLSPQAKRVILQSPLETVTGILELSAAANPRRVREVIESCGGKLRSSLPESPAVALNSQMLTFEIGAAHLAELADLDDVVYVSTGESYRL